MKRIAPTNREIFISDEDLIVSKTDLQGTITYANSAFLRVAGYTEAEVLGSPHSLVRHPDMPACVFQLIWETLQSQKEVFAYLLNIAKNGDFYWVFAHLTPSFDALGNHIGYHSNRRVPYSDALSSVKPLYTKLLQVERRYPNRKDGLRASADVLQTTLAEAGMSYSQFVFSLSKWTNPSAAQAESKREVRKRAVSKNERLAA